MQGYMNRSLYVTTVMPTPAKFSAFWSEIYAQSCNTCVMLNEMDNTYEVGCIFSRYLTDKDMTSRWRHLDDNFALTSKYCDVVPTQTV